MFAYRCQSCGFKLGDGMPPAEALTFEQRTVVGTPDGTGLRFDGTSGYQFCSFCLLFEAEYGTMYKKEHPHYQFSDLGRAGWIDYPESIGAYYDPVFANWNLMLYTQGIDARDLPGELKDMWTERLNYVEAMTKKIDNDNKKREMEMKKLHNRIKRKIRTIKFRLWEKVPYHLLQGLEILWETVTFPRNLTPEEVDEWMETFYWDAMNWHYENRASDPFAKFELWALDQRVARFDRLYTETEEVHLTEEDFPITTLCNCGHMASTHKGFCRRRRCRCVRFIPRNYKENN